MVSEDEKSTAASTPEKTDKPSRPEPAVQKEAKDQAILNALRSKIKTINELSDGVDRIATWINEHTALLRRNPDYQTYLDLEANSDDPVKIMICEAVLRLLGNQMLSEQERRDANRPIGAGVQGTTRPNVYLYWEHYREQKFSPLKEKYTIVISREMVFPAAVKEKIGKQKESAKEPAPQPVAEEEKEALEAKVKEEIKQAAPMPEKPEKTLPEPAIPPEPTVKPAPTVAPFMEVKPAPPEPVEPEKPAAQPEEPSQPEEPAQKETYQPEPSMIAPQAAAGPVVDPEPPEKFQERPPKKPIGIFETINNLLIGDEDDE